MEMLRKELWMDNKNRINKNKMKNEKQQVCENCTGCALYRIMGKDESKGCIYFVKRPECQSQRSSEVKNNEETGITRDGSSNLPADTFVLADKVILKPEFKEGVIRTVKVKEFIRRRDWLRNQMFLGMINMEEYIEKSDKLSGLSDE